MEPFDEYLKNHHAGEENAITDRELRRSYGLHGAELRALVNALRQNGVPICSSERGYYFAAGKRDIEKTIDHLAGRQHSLSLVIAGLRDAAEAWGEP